MGLMASLAPALKMLSLTEELRDQSLMREYLEQQEAFSEVLGLIVGLEEDRVGEAEQTKWTFYF